MIPHIDKNGEACIIVAINSEARAKAAKVMGTVSLGNKAIKGVAKVREAMQASAAGRGEPPKMNMATSVASARQRLSDNRKAAAAQTPANKAAAANRENEASISKLKAKAQFLGRRENQAFARSKKERDTVGKTEKYYKLDVAQGRLSSKREDNAKLLKAARQKRQANSAATANKATATQKRLATNAANRARPANRENEASIPKLKAKAQFLRKREKQTSDRAFQERLSSGKTPKYYNLDNAAGVLTGKRDAAAKSLTEARRKRRLSSAT